ncbi:ROK family protein [Lacticaseibacillus hegangensis]|uniref:ROK family protein n=1 Tax=Lacticaseibacillus hegangensis TaxID=2486010 RepID=A0ABW4CU26_9LACO|nr:ROK family protein [Lacticaseibacillus hegangensis]
MKTFVGFDVGGTTIKYGLVSAAGKILDHGSFKTLKRASSNVNKMVGVVTAYQKQQVIDGVGVDAPGIVDKAGYMITGGAIDSFYQYPLGKTLADQLKLPVKVENDANAAAIAERWLGNAKDVDDYICLVLGTGIGGGLVLNGQVYRGAHGMAGEIGWSITHDLDFRDDLEGVSLNYSASVVTGLVRRYNLSLQHYDSKAKAEQDAAQIIALAHEDDMIAQPIYSQFLSDVVVMLMNLIGTLDPERILIGGGISQNDLFMQDLQGRFDEFIARHHGLSSARQSFPYRIMPAGLRNNAGLIGAVYPLTR